MHFRAAICVLVAGGLACRAPERDGKHSSDPLTSVADVRALREEAAQGRPVRLRGIVTSYGNEGYVYYLQDATGGIRVDPAGGRGHPNVVAERVEVEGVSG